LNVLDLYKAYVADFTGFHHGPGLANQRIARVIVGQTEDLAGFFRRFDDILSVGDGVRDGFIADDMKAGVHGGYGIGMMGIIRRHDGHRIDSVLTGAFGGEHCLNIRICSVGGYTQFDSGLAGFFRI
jgi:hypothetical protein